MPIEKIGSWEEADAALCELGETQAGLLRLNAKLSLKIAEIKERAVQWAKPGQEREKELAAGLEEFWKKNRGGDKSRKLNFGTIGQRAGKLSVRLMRGWKLDQAITALRAQKLAQFIRVKEELRKPEIIAVHGSVSFDEFGIAVKPGKDTFFAEPDLTQIIVLEGKEAA